MKLANIILCLTHFITHGHVFTLYYPEWNLLELEQSIDKFLVGCKVDVQWNLDAYDTECSCNIGWSELEH